MSDVRWVLPRTEAPERPTWCATCGRRAVKADRCSFCGVEQEAEMRGTGAMREGEDDA